MKTLLIDTDNLIEISENEQLKISGGSAEDIARGVGYAIGFGVGYVLFGGLIAGVIIGKQILS